MALFGLKTYNFYNHIFQAPKWESRLGVRKKATMLQGPLVLPQRNVALIDRKVEAPTSDIAIQCECMRPLQPSIADRNLIP